MEYKVKLMSDKYHEVVLGRKPFEYPKYKLAQHQASWEQFGLQDSKDTNEEVALPIPEGLGHWQDMIDLACETNIHLLSKLEDITNWTTKLPSNFRCPTGWSYWDSKDSWVSCKPPSNRVMILDFEAVNLAKIDEPPKWVPVCCLVLLKGTWLTWRADLENLVTVIPFGKANLVHGWNIPYDRQYLDVEYFQSKSGNRFSDGMSQWIVTRGVTNQQKPAWVAHKKEEDAPLWVEETTGASLNAVYEFYYGSNVDKTVRTGIYEGGLEYYRNNTLTVLEYCAKDVLATLDVHKRLYPEYCQHRPSPVSRIAALMLGSVWLPMSKTRFPGFYDRVEQQYQETKKQLQVELYGLARLFLETALEQYPTPDLSSLGKDVVPMVLESWVNSMPRPWQSLNWDIARSGKNKGVPKWYREIKLQDISVHKRWVPIVLGLCWHGLPVFWAKGWFTEKGAIEHPDDKNQVTTDLFIKGFTGAFEEGIITGSKAAKEMLAKATSTINWVSMRKRVSAIHQENFEGYPVVLPQIAPNGTVTGRCADSLWQVLPNPKPKRLGTELKSMVEPPEGYSIVGGDIESQELRLAALMGDMESGYVGSTPLGLMVAIGQKSQKTDVHSATASKLGISRDAVKTLVYGVVYGLGVKGATEGLMQNLLTSFEECEKLAREFLSIFKGIKSQVTRRYFNGLASESFNQMETIADSKQPATTLLGNRLTKSLAGVKDFKPTRVNWTIQASGVDFRDMLLLYTEYFYKLLGVRGRLLMTIHDEIRTLVDDRDIANACHALQLAHMYTWAAFTDVMGLNGMPVGGAWFSSLDVDKVLRKEPVQTYRKDGSKDGNAECTTPSQTTPVPDTYGLTPKQLLGILQPSLKVKELQTV